MIQKIPEFTIAEFIHIKEGKDIKEMETYDHFATNSFLAVQH